MYAYPAGVFVFVWVFVFVLGGRSWEWELGEGVSECWLLLVRLQL